jgi:transketolase
VPIRVLEQIKIDVCYENLPVTFIGDGAGVVYAQLGTSHQSTEDIAALRAIPQLSIYSPADRFELTACMRDISATQTPAYLRMGKADLGDVHPGPLDSWCHGDAVPLTNEAHSSLFIATGSGVKLAQKVAAAIGGADIVSVPCIKPFPVDSIRRLAAGRQAIVTFEEHSIYGGLGGAVAETLMGSFVGAFVRVGIQDRFSTLCGNYAYLMESHGLSPDAVEEQIKKALDAGV